SSTSTTSHRGTRTAYRAATRMPSTEGRPQTKPSRRPNGSSTPSPATTAVPASTTSSNRPTSSKPIPRGGARKSAASSRRLQIETHAADPQALAVRAESTVARDRQCTRRAGGGKPHRRDALGPGTGSDEADPARLGRQRARRAGATGRGEAEHLRPASREALRA